MLAFSKYTRSVIIIFMFTIKLLEAVSVSGIIDPNNPKTPLLRLPFMKKPKGIPSEGIFERFLRQLLDVLLTNFSERKIIRYCRALSRHLEDMEYRYANRLGRHLKHLSRMYRDDLKNEIRNFRREFAKNLPHRTEFLEAMNEVFTLRENQQFEDYIYELKNYGTEDKLYIDDETHTILNDVIVGAILKASKRDQKNLLSKLRQAITEYSEM